MARRGSKNCHRASEKGKHRKREHRKPSATKSPRRYNRRTGKEVMNEI